MADYNEKPFESEICAHLEANGWLYSLTSAGYDKQRAMFPEDLLAWLSETQPDELAKVVKAGPQEAKQREQLLDRVRKVLDTPHSAGGGTINLLRQGLAQANAKLQMSTFRPESGLNPETLARYAKMRLRVVRQVFYSGSNKNSIDLVLFVNGIAVATIELKTDFTQSVGDAIAQYRNDRLPKGEPLLTPISGALVHFAVSNSEVHMTTKLAGAKTYFLPFNLGSGHGAGNPVNPHGSATSYLWERVLQRDAWLDILGKFVFIKEVKSVEPITGAKVVDTSLRFPRLHQWDVVTKLVETSRTEGAGHRYLIQHSAGSGKTDSISWTANRLSRLHDAADQPVFDSVIVITDRTVLDDQLQKAVRQIERDAGYVATIDDEAIRNTKDVTSKSGVLAAELLKGTRIIVVTIQTFPYALEAIQKEKGLAGKRFAVIADEAHSSQTGQTANKVKEVLSAEELADVEDGGEISVEDQLAAEMATRADSSNISFYAFTATPKAKTLELFGRPGHDGKPAPFHLYTMKQAIEEGFILDVLRGYQTYDTAFQIAQTAESSEEIVDQAEATKHLMRWVALHPTNIGQKVQIIVEHFRANVAGLLDGHAKAMVVTSSRKAAVRYKAAIDAYIAEKGYSIGTLVAFSGGVTDPETDPTKDLTESNMNPALRGRDLPTAFATDEFQIMLVANKFQTGFDQPLLSAMYVDKRLAGVTAVQTLSRLNRTYVSPDGQVKGATMVLDFVNDVDEIQTAFEPYYEDAHLETETDPNVVHDIRTKLDQSGHYDQDDVDRVAAAFVGGKGNNVLSGALAPIVHRFQQAWTAAVAADDKGELDELEVFRRDVGTYVRVYDFMSQVIDYGDVELEKRSIFYRLLERLIRAGAPTEAIDLSGVTLRQVKQIDRGATDIKLGTEVAGLIGVTGAGSGVPKDPTMVAFQDVIDKLNEVFGADLTVSQKQHFVQGLVDTLGADDRLVRQASANSEKQFLESPDLRDGVMDAVAGNEEASKIMADVFYGDSALQIEMVRLVGRALFKVLSSGS
ncbi:type I restriction endonuclease subunit R [Aeromicrobium sp.]|uniref:type I restriction endonuclease subunit R n=1 Tax=Aeromicrobium sp. TaxID=1871063 RepID=UPI002FC6A99F